MTSQEEVETNTTNDSIDNDTDDEWCETNERSSDVMDTLLQEIDIIYDGDQWRRGRGGHGTPYC